MENIKHKALATATAIALVCTVYVLMPGLCRADHSDSYMWQWMSGANTRNQAGVYDENDMPGAVNVPGTRWAGVLCMDSFDNPGLFGGDAIGTRNDLRRYEAAAKCETEEDCEGGKLCNSDTGACVVCLYDNHCPGGFGCVDNTCNEISSPPGSCQITFSIGPDSKTLPTTEISATDTAVQKMALHTIKTITDPVTTDCPDQTLDDIVCDGECCVASCQESCTNISVCIDGTINKFPCPGGPSEILGTWDVVCSP